MLDTVLRWVVAAHLMLGTLVYAAQGVSEEGATAFAVQRMAVALAEYGDRHRDALALIVAVRMNKQIGSTLTEDVRKTSTAQPAGSTLRALDPSIGGMLARAREYAAGRADLLALIEDARAMSMRGAERGPRRQRSVVSATASEILKIRFRTGEPALFGLQGDGLAPLVVEVSGAGGRNLCRTQQPSEAQECRWMPEHDGEHEVRVLNRGERATSYTFFHN